MVYLRQFLPLPLLVSSFLKFYASFKSIFAGCKVQRLCADSMVSQELDVKFLSKLVDWKALQ